MARNKKVEILSNDKEVLHPMTDGDCVIFEDGQTLTQKLSEDDSVKYTPEIVNSSPMFKVGEGNTVDYSDNVLDGAYERATLQGQTYVNYIQESSADEVTLPTPFTEYERTQHNTLTSDEEGTLGINLVGQSYVNALQHDSEEEFVVLGESLEFQEKKVEYTNEGQIKSAMLKGQTLVNIFTRANKGYHYNTTNNGKKGFTMTGNGTMPCHGWWDLELSTTKQYILTFNININTLDQMFVIKGKDEQEITYFPIGTTGKQTVIFTPTASDIRFKVEQYVNGTIIVDNIMVMEYQEGMENWDIPYFEGMQSVTVSTRLENKLGTCTVGSIVQYAKNGKTLTTTDASARQCVLYSTAQGATNPANLKPNTEYIIGFKISNLVLDGLSSIDLTFSSGTVESGNCLFTSVTGGDSKATITSNGTYRLRRKTTDLITSSMAVIKGFTDQWENSGSSLRSMTISEIMYVEYQNGMENWDLPYFEDYQVMKPVQVESVNRNLQPLGTYSTNTSNNVSTLNDVNGYIRVVPGKKYRISCGAEIKGSTMRWFDRNKKQLEDANGLYREAPTNAYYMRLLINTDLDYLNTVQVEESADGTTSGYIDNESKTTYSWDEVILRKVGDVEDTLDLTTGEWVQRIGEIILDGSDDETWQQSNETWQQAALDTWTKTNGVQDSCGYIYYFQHNYKTRDYIAFHEQKSDLYTLCDKLPVSGFNIELSSKTNVCVAGGATPTTIQNNTVNTYIGIKLDTTKATTLNEFKAWLKQNPLKVHVVMNKPIIHKVNLSRPNLQVYDDITHVHTKCLDGTLIPNIYLPSDISYPAILEPGKKYNVCVNHTEVSADNPLKVNVGGTEITMTDSRMTLTTPATLANSNVSFTGKGNKIKESMLIKNSSLLTRDLPHFNGIGSVQLGKTIENLCSGRYIKGGSAQATLTDALDTVKITTTTQGSYVLEFPILTPLENGKTYFVYAPVSGGGWATYSFVRTYNNSKSYLRQPMGEMMNPQQYIVTIDQSDNQYVSLCIGCHGAISVGTTYTITRPILCEYEQGMENWDWESIGYFTGTKNIGNEFMRVQNKNFYPYGDSSFTGQQGNMWCWLNGKGCSFGKNCVKKNMGNVFYLKKGSYVLSYNDNNSFQTNSIQLVGEYEKIVNLNNIKQDGWYAIRVKTTTDNIPVNITNIQLEESSTATTYTAHKHNGLYITKDQPIELTWEQGNVNAGANTSWNDAIQNTVSKRIRTKLITLKPNTSYRVSLGNKNYMWYLYAFDGSNVCPHPHSFNMKPEGFMQTDFIFTTTQQLYKIALVGRKVDDTNITPSEINHIRLEEVTDVVLRGIGDVHDELDITRGIYTQRIGEIVLDGSEICGYTTNNTQDSSTMTRCFISLRDGFNPSLPKNKQNTAPISNQFIGGVWTTFNPIKSVIIGGSYDIHFILYTSDLSENSLNGCKKYFKDLYDSGNPVIVQYQLETPIVHKVHIGNKNEVNTEVAKPNDVFTLPTLYTEQTHIDLTNNGIMPKVQSRDYIAYPVLPMISRTYTLQHNLTGGVSNLTIDLLGRTQSVSYQNHKSLIYSPETMDAILHNELRISGKGKISGVMYIDGGYMDRDIPYIEGMKNAVNPIVKNVGKNLVQKIDDIWYFYDNIINYGGAKHSCGIAPVKPYTQYIINKDSILCFYDENGKCTNSPFQYFNANSPRTAPSGSKYMLVRHNGGDNATYLDGLQVVEYGQEFDNQEYKENICYADCGEIRLTPDMFEQGSVGAASIGSHYNSDKNDSDYRIRTKELIKLEIGEQYVFLGNNEKYKYSARFYDMDGNKVNHSTPYDLTWKGTTPFTILNDAPMCAFFIAKMDGTKITVDDADFNFQLVKVSEIKQMRSLPNGVHDEIDLETGKYIQRVGEVVLDGSDDEGWHMEDVNTVNYLCFDTVYVGILEANPLYTNFRISDKFNSISHEEYLSDSVEGIRYFSIPAISISRSKLNEPNVIGFKQYLSQNPITVQYELAEPIVKDVVIHNYPHSYEGGHVIIESGDPNTPITAQLTYRAVTNRSGQIQQHTEQVEKQEKEINELETLILANIHLSQTR